MKDKISKIEDCLAERKTLEALKYTNQLRELLRVKHPELGTESSWVNEENSYEVKGEIRVLGTIHEVGKPVTDYFLPYEKYRHMPMQNETDIRNSCENFTCTLSLTFSDLVKAQEKGIGIQCLQKDDQEKAKKIFINDPTSQNNLRFFPSGESIEEVEKAITQRLQEFLNEMREILPEEDFKPTNYYTVNNHGDNSQTAIGKDIKQSQVDGSNNPVSQKNTEAPINTSGSWFSELAKMVNWIKSCFSS